jgi:hypothetical protein
MEIQGTVELTSWVLSFGDNAIVREPTSLRDDIPRELRAAADHYGKNSQINEAAKSGHGSVQLQSGENTLIPQLSLTKFRNWPPYPPHHLLAPKLPSVSDQLLEIAGGSDGTEVGLHWCKEPVT